MQVCIVDTGALAIDTNPVHDWVALKDTIVIWTITPDWLHAGVIHSIPGQGICLRFRGDSASVKIKALVLRWIQWSYPDVHDTLAYVFEVDPMFIDSHIGWKIF